MIPARVVTFSNENHFVIFIFHGRNPKLGFMGCWHENRIRGFHQGGM